MIPNGVLCHQSMFVHEVSRTLYIRSLHFFNLSSLRTCKKKCAFLYQWNEWTCLWTDFSSLHSQVVIQRKLYAQVFFSVWIAHLSTWWCDHEWDWLIIWLRWLITDYFTNCVPPTVSVYGNILIDLLMSNISSRNIYVFVCMCAAVIKKKLC